VSNFVGFLKKQTPICLGLPFFKELVSSNLYYKLAERSEADFGGRNLFDQTCANARICDEECLGRPVPMYPELESIIAKYKPTQGAWNGKPVWLISIDTCKTCPFKSECKKVCPAMSAFDRRNRNVEDYHLEMTSPIEDLRDEWLEQLYMMEDGEEWHSQMQLDGTDIAWDCLSEPQKAAVMMVEVQGMTHDRAAVLRGVSDTAIAKAHASGMARLKEYGLARIALKEDRSCLFAIEYYENGNDIQGLADSFGVSTFTASTKVAKFRKKHDISK
jgi:hypothetical protein